MLRVLVDSGGCHGYQNKMELTDKLDEEDKYVNIIALGSHD